MTGNNVVPYATRLRIDICPRTHIEEHNSHLKNKTMILMDTTETKGRNMAMTKKQTKLKRYKKAPLAPKRFKSAVSP